MFDLASNRIEIDLITVQYRFNTSKMYHEKSRMSDGFVYYIKGGHTITLPDGTVLTPHASDFIYIPYGSVYDSRMNEETTEYYEIDFNLYDHGKPVSLLDECRLLTAPAGSAFLPLIHETYDSYTEQRPMYNTSCISNVLQLCTMLIAEQYYPETNRDGYRRIQRTVDHIRKHFDEDTSLTELAELSQVCVSTLDRYFKRCFEMTPIEYRNHLRIEHAKMLLAGGFSISDACEKVGFSDYFYFIRVFKKVTGMSPSRYVSSIEDQQQ